MENKDNNNITNEEHIHSVPDDAEAVAPDEKNVVSPEAESETSNAHCAAQVPGTCDDGDPPDSEICDNCGDFAKQSDISENSGEPCGQSDISDDLNEPSAPSAEDFDDTSNSTNSLEQVEHTKRFAVPGKFKRIMVTVFLIIIALWAAFYILALSTVPNNTVMRNTYVDDTYVGGMTYDELVDTLNNKLLLNDKTITLKCMSQSYVINGSDIGIAAKFEETAKRAFNFGKSGNRVADGWVNMLSYLRKNVIKPVAQIDPELLKDKVNEFGIQLYGQMVGHYVEISDTDTTVTVWPGHSGYDPDSEASYKAACDTIMSNLNDANYTDIDISLSQTPPPALSIEHFDSIVYKDPVDAYYVTENNNVEIIAEETGRYINKDEAAVLLQNVVEGGEPVVIPYYISYAAITADTLRAKLFANTIGSYSTSYGGSTANRKANVARAAELINGKVLAPGEIFSFNDTVGDRTVSNGFYTATEYQNGKSVEGIGGGTCQVSTTLYCATLYADMAIVHRENHAMSVGYVPLGQDATVAYGSVDFKFQNSSDYPIKIVASADGSTITVSILGTAWEPERTVEIKNSSTSVGADTMVSSTRYVYSNGELISTDPLSSSYYKPHTP